MLHKTDSRHEKLSIQQQKEECGATEIQRRGKKPQVFTKVGHTPEERNRGS